MTTTKPSASFPIKKISFQRNRSVAEKSFVRSHEPNSESLRILEDKKEEARIAAREAARLAARGHHGNLLGETYSNKNGLKAKWKKRDASKKSLNVLRSSPQPSSHDDDLSLGWTQTSTTEALTTVMEDGTSKSTKSKGSTSSPKKLMKKFAYSRHQTDTLHEVKDVAQLAQHLSASGAFACTICGTIYDSLANATRHEDKCLVMFVEMIEKKRNEGPNGLHLHSEHMFHKKDQAKQVPRRGLQRTNAVSSPVPVCSALSSSPRYQNSDFVPPKTGGEVALPTSDLQKHMIITDEAIVDLVRRSKYILHSKCLKELAAMKDLPEEEVDQSKKAALLLKKREFEAQQEIALLSRDRHYYGMVEKQSLERIYGRLPKHENPYKYYYNRKYAQMGIGIGSSNERDVNADKGLLPKRTWNALKHRFEHAYDLIKEGPASDADGNHIQKSRDDKNSKNMGDIVHGRNTLYVNVVVKNSVQVVNNELQRMAKGWWQSENAGEHAQKDNVLDFQFEWIRNHTQKRVIQLAAVALASDFTPRKVAVQLSNDLYRYVCHFYCECVFEAL